MGVHKLWDLLTATALPVRVESLFGKVCCIDASFWICHCLASEANVRHGGDVIGVFFLRICYLLDKGIKPVFVFDGKSPFAKMKTILRRRLGFEKAQTNHKLLAYKLLASQINNLNRNRAPFLPLPEAEAEAEPEPEAPALPSPPDEFEEPEQVPDREMLTELFPEDFMNKTDEEFCADVRALRECDFLSTKAKYELMNAVKDNIMQSDREKSLKIKDDIEDYSNHQVKAYMRDVKINAEIENVKAELYKNYFPQQRAQPLSLKHDLGGDICDYNEYFARKYDFNTEPMPEAPPSPAEVRFEEPEEPEPEADDSVFATDDQIFGDLLEGVDAATLEGTELYAKSPRRASRPQAAARPLSQEAQPESPPKPTATPSMSNNDFFLTLYRSHFAAEDSALESPSDLEEEPEEPEGEEAESEGSDPEASPKAYPKRFVSEHTEARLVKTGSKHAHYDNVQTLLELFGVPYVVAPSEAESQCAHMNRAGDCYAVISDDSDALVFGAQRLLKNFYNDNVFELYTAERISKELGIGRTQLALIAVICGCDYTSGVRGIGIVNALEVIKAYPTFEDLHEFRRWATDDCDLQTATADASPLRQAYKRAHINYRVHWTFSPDFPNREAYELFLSPNVTDRYELAWAAPRRDEILEFMAKKSSLPQAEAAECLSVLLARKAQQLIIEDVVPELRAKPVKKTAVKNYRKALTANLSVFRNAVTKLRARAKATRTTKRLIEKYHTLSKIRSRRMVESIKTIRSRYRKTEAENGP